ncbi:MAG: hypothetical protein IJ094_11140 [Bacilli bacterium]|nr:hypothetical protein [Bacilli bacterium]
MKINKKGITLVELIVSFTLVSVAVIYFYQTLYTVKKIYVDARDNTNSFVEKSYKFKLAYNNEAKKCSGGSAGIREYDITNYGTLYYYCSDNTVATPDGADGDDGGSSSGNSDQDFDTDSSLDNYFEVSKITDIDFSSDEHKTKSIENDEEIFTIINNNNNGFVYENDKNYLTVLGNGNKNFQRLIFYKYKITNKEVSQIKVEPSSTYPKENGYKGGENNPISLCEVAILDQEEKIIATTYFGGGTTEPPTYEIPSGKKFGYILLAHRSDKNYVDSEKYSCNLKVLEIK